MYYLDYLLPHFPMLNFSLVLSDWTLFHVFIPTSFCISTEMLLIWIVRFNSIFLTVYRISQDVLIWCIFIHYKITFYYCHIITTSLFSAFSLRTLQSSFLFNRFKTDFILTYNWGLLLFPNDALFPSWSHLFLWFVFFTIVCGMFTSKFENSF